MILSNPFNQQEFTDFVKDFLPNFKLDVRKVEPGNSGFREVLRLGTSFEVRTEVLVVKCSKNINSRISLTNNSFKILKKFSIYRALVVYVNDDESIWRLSLLTATPTLSSDGKTVLTLSNPRRHSYVLGTDVGIATARKYLVTKGKVEKFEELEYRFSVEAVNKDFYDEIVSHFYKLIGKYAPGNKVLEKPLLKLPVKTPKIEDLQNYSVRLLGRIIFLWFLRQKASSNGKTLLPDALLEIPNKKDFDFLHNNLEPIFFEVLNKPQDARTDRFGRSPYDQVPYLNGGLFHPIGGSAGDFYNPTYLSSKVEIPNHWFIDLFKTLNTYNFTIDENTEIDVDLSIDPEMLGRVFENLLAEIDPETGESARRTTGSFYTPRRIVNHMTDISLKQYLKETTNIDEAKIEVVISIDELDDIQNPLSEDEKRSIAEAIYALKTLDPACGSGAFPIGMLQKLVYILEQVDKNFEIGISKFSKNFIKGKEHLTKNYGYLRKLILIRDVIHGLDIQPIAVEISKLRSFLTLVVEQEVFDDLPNRGLDPLPNLDFQYICGNSLIKLHEEVQLGMWDDGQLESQLEEIRKDYYSTTSDKKRDSLKQKYAQLTKQELSLFGESKRTSLLKSFQPFVANNQALFFDPKFMFGISTFHIIIGNPPYVKTEHLSEQTRKELSENYLEYRNGKAKNWVDDLYVHFIFRAFDLVGEQGIVCFITNDSFIGLDSKIRVRRKLLNENLIALIGCPKETFGATIYTAIFLATKAQDKQTFFTGAQFSFPGFDIMKPRRVSKAYIESLPKQRFVFEEDDLITKLLTYQNLGSYLRVIDTGIHSGNVREKIFSLEKTKSINKRMIQGRQILKWVVFWDSPNAKFKYCDPNYIPKDVLGTGRGGKKSPLKEYWSFASDASNHFLPERILLRQTGDSLHAAYHNEKEDGQLYTDNTLFTVVLRDEEDESLKYFLGLLNSKVLNYVYQFLSSEEGKTLAQVKTGLVEQLPVVVDKTRKSQVIKLVNSLIESKRKDPNSDVSSIEGKLDELVCEIYELSEDEKKRILV